MKNNKSIRILSAVMATSMFLQTPVYAAAKVKKEETVYVELDSLGNPIDKTSSIWLHSDTPLKDLKDKSNLKDVINVKGDEEPEIKNNELHWSTEENEIYYQGEPNKELPFNIKIQYFLNDKEVHPEDIIGQSGKLKMKVAIENKDIRKVTLENGEKRDIYTPYLVATTINLPSEKFENIEVNTGRIVSDASHQVVGYVAIPGLKESLNLKDDLIDLPDYLELTADVEDFEMLSIAMVAKSELPDIDDSEVSENLEDLIDGVNKMVEAGQDLTDGTGKLVDGQVELYNGIDVLAQGAQKLQEGTNPLSQGTSKLKEGMDSAQAASVEVSNGSQQLSENSEKLGNAYVALSDGTVQFSEKAQELSQGVNQLGAKLNTIPDAVYQLNQGMAEVMSNMNTISQGQDALTSGLVEARNGVSQITAGKQQEAEGIEGLKQNAQYIEALISQIEDEEAKAELLSAISMQQQGLEQVSGSSYQLIGALGEVENGMNVAIDSSGQLAEGSRQLNEGQAGISAGLAELQEGTKEIPAVTQQFEEASQQLGQAAGQIKDKSLQAKNAAGQFTNGSEKLAQGSKQLSSGLSELQSGTSQLNAGMNELSNGANGLAKGSNMLRDGSSKLVDGTHKLDDGMNKFYEEGIEKLHDEVNNSDLDIEKIIEVKDKMVELSKENDTFTGKSDDMEGDLKFVIKTSTIKDEKEDEEEKEVETKETTKESKGFFNWLKSLFTKSSN